MQQPRYPCITTEGANSVHQPRADGPWGMSLHGSMNQGFASWAWGALRIGCTWECALLAYHCTLLALQSELVSLACMLPA